MTAFFEGVTADTSVEADWRGGYGVFSAFADNFGGGTVTFSWSPNDGTDFATTTDGTFTADGFVAFRLPPGRIRAELSGSSGAVNVKAYFN